MAPDRSWPIQYKEDLDTALRRVGGRMNPALGLDVHRLGVPPGDEIWWITELQRQYILAIHSRGRAIVPDFVNALAIAPNHLLDTQASTLYTFTFGTDHGKYKGMLKTSLCASTGSGVRIKIIDSGLSSKSTTVANKKVVKETNLVDSQNPTDVEDEVGHGTVVTDIIHDLAPDADMLIYKVKKTGEIIEWDVLAALSDSESASIINMSLSFGLKSANCNTCGRQSHSSRSAVFEGIIRKTIENNDKTIVVAAAGNRGVNVLSFPARFGAVMAIGSVDGSATISSFSNYGAKDHTQQPHNNLFFAPGGGATEDVGTVNPGGTTQTGTSFAAAYASGLIAKMRSDIAWQSVRAANFVDDLRTFSNKPGVSTKMPGFVQSDHGNGLLQLS